MLNESILDIPVKSLSPLVWTKTTTGSYILNNNAKRKIRKLCDFLFSKKSINWMNKTAAKNWHVEDYGIHIIGSITSNTYTDTSDIDLHFIIPTIPKEDSRLFSETLRANYRKNYIKNNKSDCYIGNAKQHYQFELYYQPNPYIDMTSVGCYDVINSKWEVGPTLYDKNYNPYDKFFKKSYKYVDDIISDVRNIILEPYELSKILDNLKTTDPLYDYITKQIIKCINKSWNIIIAVWNKRNFDTNVPMSKSDAAKIRKNNTKHIHDAAFKFLEKFGYISILREYANIWEDIQNKNFDIKTVKNNILKTVSNFIKADSSIVRESLLSESTIDFPHNSLNKLLWNSPSNENADWSLKLDVHNKLQNIIFNVSKLVGIDIKYFNVYLIGSNASNSFTKNADIDLHFQLKNDYKLNNYTISELQNKFKDIEHLLFRCCPANMIICGFPVELYFQPNKFQDMMSVGCYDVLNKKWEVKPSLMPLKFDPYSEYYLDVQKRINLFSTELRNIILSIYEKSIDVSNMDPNSKIFDTNITQLLLLICNGIKLFKTIKQTRNVFSCPKTKEEALQFRASKKWKIADATIKLIDKYGYSWIFIQLESLINDIGIDNISLLKEMLPIQVLKIIKYGIKNSVNLAE